MMRKKVRIVFELDKKSSRRNADKTLKNASKYYKLHKNLQLNSPKTNFYFLY